MSEPQFFERAGSRLMTPDAFGFVLEGELKRAVRAQNFLTLVVLETRREWEGIEVTADEGTIEAVAQAVSRELRETDLMGRTEKGTLSLVLLDADFESSTGVIDRLMARLGNYQFPSPLRISVGAACYPTHAVDVRALNHQALARSVVNWRSGEAGARNSSSRQEG